MNDDHEFWKEWINDIFDKHGLTGMVNVKGFQPNYKELVGVLDAAGVDHGFDAIHDRGLGQHIEDIFEMACAGDSSSQIAEYLGAKTKTVSRFCRRHGIELLQPLTLKDMEDDIAASAKTMTIPEIAREYEFSESGIAKFLKKSGIKAKSARPGYIIHNGYRKNLVPDHPDADSKGYVGEHRLVAEEKIGRRLRKDEVAHHINGDKLDNRPDNIEVMSDSEHRSHHAKNGDSGWGKYHQDRNKI